MKKNIPVAADTGKEILNGSGRKAATASMGMQRRTARERRVAIFFANHMAYILAGRQSSYGKLLLVIESNISLSKYQVIKSARNAC